MDDDAKGEISDNIWLKQHLLIDTEIRHYNIVSFMKPH